MKRNAVVQFLLLPLLACHAGSGPESLATSSVPGGRSASVEERAPSKGPLPSDGMAEIRNHLLEREYWASSTPDGLQAPNRAHDLRTYFDARGVRVEDRNAPDRSPLVDLSLVRMGRERSLANVPNGQVVHLGEGRVEIRRQSLGLVEWFDNRSDGLEQGFTLSAPPIADATRVSPLVLELSVVDARADLREDKVALETATGRRLDYGHLVVRDATGTSLVARFEVPSSDRIRILVDDRLATYPVVIDPLLTGAFDAVVESNLAFSEFGSTVASAGDVDGDGYDDVIVGADAYDQGQTDEGAAFVFRGGPTGIGNGNPTTAHAVLQGDQVDGRFGSTVSSAGDVNGDGYDDVIVGAYLFNAGQADEGAAFVFHGSPAGIASGGPAIANGSMESNQTDAQLGLGVASAGDVNADGYGDVIVGSFLYDAGQTNEGAAFVLLGSPTGIGNRNPTSAHARFESDQADAWMGFSVAGAGDIDGDGDAEVLVGAPFMDFLSTDEGVAVVYLGSPGGIASGNPATAHARFYGQASTRTGTSVAGAGDVNGDGFGDVIIGSPFHSHGNPNEGAAFVFAGSASGFAGGSYLPNNANRVLESNQAEARFGSSVASAGDVNADGYADVVVGAYAYDSGQVDEGVAFVYAGSATGVDAEIAKLEFDQATAFLGYSVASAGDVDADGFDDVIVGAYLANGGQADEGSAFVYHGGARGFASGPITNASVSMQSNQAGANLGFSLASAGDVNADGFDDFIVGAPGYDVAPGIDGAAFVFHGSSLGFAGLNLAVANATLSSDQAGFSFFGLHVSSAGDVNGDGFGDVIVGAPLYSDPESQEGAAFVFLGSSSGVGSRSSAAADARLQSNQVDAGFGQSVGSAGDVDGDGFGDVLVGAAGFDGGTVDEGAAFIFSGGPAGIAHGDTTSAATRLESDQGASAGFFQIPMFGLNVASAGDINGDGYGDVVVGSPGFEAGTQDEGAAFVFLGSPTGVASATPATAHARIEGEQSNASFGLDVATAGDVDADGIDDLIVGASAGNSLDGGPAAYVFLGSNAGIPNGSAATAHVELALDSPFPLSNQNVSVSTAGDVNADGHADVAIAYFNLTFLSDSGASIHLGTEGGMATTPYATLGSITSSQLAIGNDILSGIGDVDADGFGDIAVGSAWHSQPEGNEGLTAIYLGNRKPGRAVSLRQRRGDGSGIPVAPRGSAHSSSAFVAEVRARSAFGRERAKIEVEACPVGRPFGSVGCLSRVSPSWVDLSTNGAVLSETVSGLVANTTYSWRARILTLPFSAVQPGIAARPRKGPWLRVGARAEAGDIRTVPEPAWTAGLIAAIAWIGLVGRRASPNPPRG
ncbi:MAG: integrin alpha [Myxococcota bacterium]